MYEARTLAEFAARQFRNDLRQVGRSRLRASMWVFSTVVAIGFVVLRIVTVGMTHYDSRGPYFDEHLAALYTGAFLFYLAVPMLASRAPGAQFANVAEALLIGTSQLRVRGIFILLQLRALWRTLARSFLVLVIVATSGNANPSELARVTLFTFIVALVPPAFAFHLSILSERARLLVRGCGFTLIALAVAIGFGWIPHGGAVMLAQVHGAWWPAAIGLVLATYGVCVPPVADPIPELFAATKSGGSIAQRVANRVKRDRPSDGGRLSDWVFDLRGEWVIFSARLAAFIRVRTPLVFAGGLLAWFSVGIAIGVARQVYGPQSDEVLGASLFPVVLIVCIIAATIGRDLGLEIRNPIWWTGDATLSARLRVDSIASMWRFAISVAAVFIGYAAFGHYAVAFFGFIAFSIAVWLARCCGYLLFAYFPAAIDQRGGLAGLRIFILAALAMPVFAVAVTGLVLRLPIPLQFTIDALTAIAEALLLVWISARRIDGRLEAYL